MTLNGRSVVIHGLYDASDNLHVSQAFMHLFQAGKSGFQPELGLSGMLGFGVALPQLSLRVLNFFKGRYHHCVIRVPRCQN